MNKAALLGIFCLVLLHGHAKQAAATAPCTGEAADICGFLPSTYGDLGIGGVPALCNANCTLPGNFDRCGVCGGDADYYNELLEPLGLLTGARVGGSVANWNGTVAASQHIDQELTPLISVPITTWNLDHDTGLYDLYELPWAIGDSSGDTTKVPVGRGYALIMSENYLVVGSHDTQPRVTQLWTRTPASPAPWSHTWTTIEFCANNHFGFSVAIDERIPKDGDDGIFSVIAVGDPGAFFSGRVAVYLTYSPGILQILNYGTGNETERACYGRSVSSDSGLLAVGAPSLDYASNVDAGNVFVYKWDPSVGIQGEYVYLLTITPPTPVLNGGFGESVSVWDCWIMVGDNMHNVYLYKIIGAVAVPLSFQNPSGTNLVSRLGYTVSIWDQYAIAGDENFIVSPSARGATFVWNDNPLDPYLYRHMYRLNDELSSFNTRFGAYVDVRGGCIVASGAPAEGELGGVWVTNLCRGDCYGCDGILNSCEQFDFCGVCSGNNGTCIDCFGVLNGPAQLDSCGVCTGTNITCVNPTASPSTIMTPCETAFDVTLGYEFQNQFGNAVYTVVSPFPTNGAAAIVLIPGGALLTYTPTMFASGVDSVTVNVTVPVNGVWETIVIPVTIGSCIDCFGVLNGPARNDLCGVCVGDNTTCAGCDGVPNSGAVIDYCGVCGGTNSTCASIVIPPLHIVNCTSQIIFPLLHEPANHPVMWSIVEYAQNGLVYVDAMAGIAWYQNPAYMGPDSFKVMIVSLLNSSITDMQNVTLYISPCVDCAGDQYGIQIVDLCGICGGDSLSCKGCDGVPNSGKIHDACGVCDGDGTSCLDCLGIQNGGTPEICGICGNTDYAICQGDASGVSFLFFVMGVALAILFLTIAGLWCCNNTYEYAKKDKRSRKANERVDIALKGDNWLDQERQNRAAQGVQAIKRNKRFIRDEREQQVREVAAGTDPWVRAQEAAAVSMQEQVVSDRRNLLDNTDFASL